MTPEAGVFPLLTLRDGLLPWRRWLAPWVIRHWLSNGRLVALVGNVDAWRVLLKQHALAAGEPGLMVARMGLVPKSCREGRLVLADTLDAVLPVATHWEVRRGPGSVRIISG